MADILGLPFNSLRFSSSLLTSFASSLNSLQPAVPARFNSDKKVHALSYSSIARLAFRPKEHLLSFKVSIANPFVQIHPFYFKPGLFLVMLSWICGDPFVIVLWFCDINLQLGGCLWNAEVSFSCTLLIIGTECLKYYCDV